MYAENDSKEALEEMSETARSMIGNIEILSIEKSIEIEKKT
jgi:hypothetical protein